MGRLLKLIFTLAVLGFAGLAGYAYLGDLTPTVQRVEQPVTLNAD